MVYFKYLFMLIALGDPRVAVAEYKPTAWQQQWLDAHNEERATKNIAPLKWDKRLVDTARKWTAKLAKECNLVHSDFGYGENLAASFGGNGKPKTPREVTGMWIKEKNWYDYKTNKSTNGKAVGHYTQVMWKTSKFVGCWSHKCDNKNGYVYSCNYDPPGNFRGRKPW